MQILSIKWNNVDSNSKLTVYSMREYGRSECESQCLHDDCIFIIPQWFMCFSFTKQPGDFAIYTWYLHDDLLFSVTV